MERICSSTVLMINVYVRSFFFLCLLIRIAFLWERLPVLSKLVGVIVSNLINIVIEIYSGKILFLLGCLMVSTINKRTPKYTFQQAN